MFIVLDKTPHSLPFEEAESKIDITDLVSDSLNRT